MSEKFLEIKGLTVEYTSGKHIIHAVNDVSLALDKGKTLGLVGETGAGKTSIAKSILRILPDRASKIVSGEIWLDEEDLLRKSEKEMLHIRGKKVAMIFQDPMTALNPVMTVGAQIAETIRLHENLGIEASKQKACEMLEMVGIPRTRFSEYPHQFSGGMKQRVVIAMALACDPELLLADEPTTALDVTIQAQVLEMINELKVKFNTAMILITHDLGVVAETCDTVAVVYAGEIVEFGDKEQVFRRPKHPYTKGLFDSLPSLYDDRPRLSPIQGLPPDPSNLPIGCAFSPRCTRVCESCHESKPAFVEVEPGHFCRCMLSQEV